MKKISLVVGTCIGLGVSMGAMAAPSGFYAITGAGLGYLPDAKLTGTTITTTEVNLFAYTYGIQYNQGNAFDYFGRAALGYFYNPDEKSSQAFGLEAGFNYFGPVKSTVLNTLSIPIINVNYGVTTSQKTNAWAADLDGVYSHDISTHASLILKLGLGYENSHTTITNTVAGLPNQLPNAETSSSSGIDANGGVGIQYDFSPHVGLRAEVDGLKGGQGVQYVQGLVGLVWKFGKDEDPDHTTVNYEIINQDQTQ